MSRVAKRVLWAAAILLALGAAGLVCQRVAARGRYAADYSTYGAGPTGARGLYLLADELGARPQRWSEDLGRLPDGGMLVALGSCDQLMLRELGRFERQNLERWVRDGGVLVVAGVPDYLSHESFGVELVTDPASCTPTEGLVGMMVRAERGPQKESGDDEADDRDLEELPDAFRDDPVATYEEVTEQQGVPDARLAVGTAGPLAGAPLIGMRRPLELSIEADADAATLLHLDGPEGRPVGVRVDVGRGAVIALSSGSAFQNRDLAAQNGGVLFARLVRELAPEGPVLFDEYHLGVGERRSMMRYLRQVGAGAVIVQVLLLVLFVLWRLGARFGATRSDPPADPAGTASYVEGVGTLYAQAKDAAGALAILARRGIERIAAHHHLEAGDADKLAAELDRRHRREAAEAVRAIASTSRPSKRVALASAASEIDAAIRRALADDGA